MFGLSFGVIVFVAGIILAINFATKKEEYETEYKKDSWGNYARDSEGHLIVAKPACVEYPYKKYSGFTFAGAVVLGIVFIFLGCVSKVNTGNVGVVKTFGRLEDKTLESGLKFVAPWQDVVKYDSTVQQLRITTSAYSKDGQTMDLEVYLQYQIQKDKLILKDENGKVLQSEGIAGKYVTLASLEDRIETQCIEKTKAVMSSAEAMTIIQERATYSALVSETVREAIGQDYYVNVQDVVLTDISFSAEFEKNVEDKVAAEQAAQKAINDKQKAITEAEAKKAVAELEADAALYKASKEAEAILVRAQAEADALKLEKKAISEAINTLIIDLNLTAEQATKLYEYLIWTEKWDGDVPTITGENSGYIVVPQN